MNKRIIFLVMTVVMLSSFAFAYDQENSMVKISGKYGTSFSLTSDSFDWKNANGDYQENNWRYATGEDGVNTYDTRVFSRFQADIETDTGSPWNFGTQIKVDPWSWTGIGQEQVYDEREIVPGITTGDYVDVQYLYWANTGKSVNRTFRTHQGNFFRTPEVKAIKGKLTDTFVSSGFDWRNFEGTLSENRSVKIDYYFRPVRKLWAEYNDGDLYMKIFPLGDQWEAYTSDDPLSLSNNRVYWAPSPWTWSFDPGMDLDINGSGTLTYQRARWNWDLQWFAEDSNRTYLTYLRGMTMKYNYEDTITFDVTAASPMTPWQAYDDVDSVPMAMRLKFMPDDKWTFGTTYTAKYGIDKKTLKAMNHVGGFDVNYKLDSNTDVFGQYALSYLEIKQPMAIIQKNVGYAYTIGAKAEYEHSGGHSAQWDLKITSMGRDFHPGLSDYRDTRRDREWSRHVRFDPLSWEDDNSRIGNSIDVNRFVIGANAKLNLSNDLLQFYFNWRNAHAADTGKFIENITRFEATYNPRTDLQIKALALHRAYHDTVAGLDPLIRDRYTDLPYNNDTVTGGQQVQLATFSIGAKKDLWQDRMSISTIFESTNDPQDFPRQELMNHYGSAFLTQDGITSYELTNDLYLQSLFNQAPYQFYNIWKTSVSITPVDQVTFVYTYVYNGNKNYAALFDQNNAHHSIDVYATPVKNVSVYAGYTYSLVNDLKRMIDSSGFDRFYGGHHNVYVQVNWVLPDDQKLTLQWGETWFPSEVGDLFGPSWLATSSSVLDTRHIFRLYFQGTF